MTTAYRNPTIGYHPNAAHRSMITDLYVPPPPHAVPVNSIPLVLSPANASETVNRSIPWGAGWTGVTNGVDTYTLKTYFNGSLVDTQPGLGFSNFPGGNILSVYVPEDALGVGTYRFGVIVTNAYGPSLEYLTNNSIAT